MKLGRTIQEMADWMMAINAASISADRISPALSALRAIAAEREATQGNRVLEALRGLWR